MITTVRTTVEGRTYEVVADSAKINEAFFLYVQIYRIRKDGSRGLQLQTHNTRSWRIWSTVRDEVRAREAA